MLSVCRLILALGIAILFEPFGADAARAQSPSLTQKINADVECKAGPTGRERIIYGTYTIHDTSGGAKF